MEILGEYLKLIGWGIVGILTMVLSLWIVLLVFTWLTPVDEWEELKKGNLAMALVMAAVIISFAISRLIGDCAAELCSMRQRKPVLLMMKPGISIPLNGRIAKCRLPCLF